MKYYEASVELRVPGARQGKFKKVKETYLVDSQSVTEAEARVIQGFTDEGAQVEYEVKGVKESKVMKVIST